MPSYLYLSLAQVIREHSTNKHRVPNTISVSTIISHNMKSIDGRGLRGKDMVGILVWDQVLGVHPPQLQEGALLDIVI